MQGLCHLNHFHWPLLLALHFFSSFHPENNLHLLLMSLIYGWGFPFVLLCASWTILALGLAWAGRKKTYLLRGVLEENVCGERMFQFPSPCTLDLQSSIASYANLWKYLYRVFSILLRCFRRGYDLHRNCSELPHSTNPTISAPLFSLEITPSRNPKLWRMWYCGMYRWSFW